MGAAHQALCQLTPGGRESTEACERNGRAMGRDRRRGHVRAPVGCRRWALSEIMIVAAWRRTAPMAS